MPKYKDIKLTGATQVSRRHARDISPPGMEVLKNGYISRSDSVPQVRPKLTPITDTLTSIPGTSIVVPSGDVAADFLNSYFFSWGANAGFYLTKYGPIYAAGDSGEVLYDTYDAGTFSCESANTTIVTFSVEDDASLIENVWPGCLLLYSGTYYIFESIISDSVAVLKTSPGAVTDGANTIIRVHNSDRADMPFNISQYGVNMVYSTPYYRLPMDSSKISGPFYLPLNDYTVASPWKDTSSSVTFAPDVYGFAEWLRWHPTHAYERATAWRSAVPLMWNNGTLSSVYSIASASGTANANLLPAGVTNVDDDAVPRYTTIDPMAGFSTGGSTIAEQAWSSLADTTNLATAGTGWTRTVLEDNTTNFVWQSANSRMYSSAVWRSKTLHLKNAPSIKDGTIIADIGLITPSGIGYTWQFGVAFRASASAGYVVVVQYPVGGPGALLLYKYSGATFTQIGSGDSLAAQNILSDSRIYLKVQYNGPTITAKAWLTSDAEPASWTLSETDSTILTTGLTGFYNNYRHGVSDTLSNYWYDFEVLSVPLTISSNVTSLAYGSEADGELALYTGLADGSLIKTSLTAGYGAGNAQHFLSFSTSYPTVLDNGGSRTTINRIRDVGYTLHAGDSEVWGVCDAGIILYNIDSDAEVDLGAIGDLYDVASSRRPKTGSSIDGDVVAVGAGGVIYYIPAEDDPSTDSNWTAAASGITNDLNWCLYSKYNDKFLAVSVAGDVLLSDNPQGDAWTAKTTPSSGYTISGVDCDEEGRIFVFVTSDNKAWATTDFTNYTDVTPDSLDDETLLDVTYCLREGKFVLGGTDGYIEDVRLRMKPSGTATTVASGGIGYVYAMTYFNSLFVALTKTQIKTTTGGAGTWSWTDRQALTGSIGTSAFLIDDGTTLVAVYNKVYGWYSRISTDGTTWGDENEIVTGLAGPGLPNVAYDSTNSQFLFKTNTDSLYFSADGETWGDVSAGANYLLAGFDARRNFVDQQWDIVLVAAPGSGTLVKLGKWTGATYSFSSAITTSATSRFDSVDWASSQSLPLCILDGDGAIVTPSYNFYVRLNDENTPATVEVVSPPGLTSNQYSTSFTYPVNQYVLAANWTAAGKTVSTGTEVGLAVTHGLQSSYKSAISLTSAVSVQRFGVAYDSSDLYVWALYAPTSTPTAGIVSIAKIADTLEVEEADY